MSKSKYICEQCDKKYLTKSLLQQHQPICIYIHSLSTQHEKSVQIPSQEIMFQYIVHLTKKYEKLEEKVKNMEKMANYKKKMHINEYLKNTKKPIITYTEWVNQLEVSEYDLNQLFENDLKTCIKSVLEDMLDSDMPLVAFREKKNEIYIYDDEKWHAITKEEFNRLISIVSHRVLKKYVSWADKNKEIFDENPKNQELSMIYMCKANGLNVNIEKMTAEIKKWLFTHICVSVKDMDVENE